MKNKEKSITKKALEEIKYVAKLDADIYNLSWDGRLSYNGIKRMIYALSHNGCNEYGDSVVSVMTEKAQEAFWELVSKYKEEKELLTMTRPC